MPDILDSLYDDLKGQGYLQKDKLTFRRYMMASGADGYKNRKALYDDLKGQGYLNSPTYEDFASRIFSSVAKGWTPSQSGNRRPQAAPRRVNSQNTGVRNREVEAGGARSIVPQGFGDLDMQSASWGALGQTMPEKVAEQKKRIEESYGWTDDLAGATRRAHDTATHKAVKGDREAQKKLGVDRAMQQHRDRLDYAMATGEELRHNISTGGVDEKTGEALGFDETRFGIAPTVGRDEQGNILYGEDGKPLVGLASDEVRSGVQQVEQERVYREDLDRKINEARAEQERIEQLLNQRSEQLLAKHREKEDDKSFWQRTLEGMSSGDPMFQRQQDFGLATDNEFLTLQSALHENERYIKELEAASENAGFWRGTANVLTDPSTYSFGLTDLFDATSLSRIGNKIEMAREDGIAPNLTESEEALAFNYLLKREAEGLNADKKWYHRGQGFGHTISFMKDFALSGGGFANLAKQGMSLGTKAGTKLATRMLGDYMKKNLGTKALGKTIIYSSKGLGLAAGAEVGGFALNNTVQAASSIADIVNRRTGELAVGQDGNLTVEGGMSLASAFLTSQLSRTGENASELVGLGFDAIPGILGKVIQRTTTGKFLKKLADNKFWKGAEGTLNYLGVQSVWGELMEEEYGMARTELLNRITNGRFAPEGSGLFDAEQQLETAITVGLTSMLLRVPSMVVSGASTANYYANKYNLNSSDRQMRTVFGDDARYQSVKSMIDGADNKQMAGVLNRLMNTAGLSSDEKQSMFMYANDLVKLRGFNMGNVVAAANGYTEPPRVSGYNVNGNTVEEVDQDGNVLSTHEYEDREAMKAGLYELQQQRFDKTLQDDLGIMRARPDGQYDALVEQYCQQAGITTEEFDAMLNKPSMERTETEQQMVAPFADLLHNSVYDNTVLHEEQSRQDGEDIADADSIDLEEGGEQGVDMASQWAEAQEVRRVAFERNENLKEEVERMEDEGFSPQEVIAQLETFRPEDVESIIGYYNAKAKFEGYMNRKSEKIDEEARNLRERHTFKGTVNGQADLRNVYTITDGVNEYFLVSGNLTTDPDGKITGSDSGLIIGLDSDGSFVQLSETDGYSVMPVAQSLDEFEEAERIRLQEQVSASIDPEGRLAPQPPEGGGMRSEEAEDVAPVANDGNGGVDENGNTLNSDGSVFAESINSIDEISDEEFEEPTRSVVLPPLTENVAAAIGSNGKPVIIKKNIFQKNAEAHPDLDASDSRQILNDALYRTNLVGQTQPITRPDYKVAIHLGDKSSVVVLDIYQDKKQVEIVGWRRINEKGLAKMQRQAEREGGQFLILSPYDGSAAALSALPQSSSSEGKVTENSGNGQGIDVKIDKNGVKLYEQGTPIDFAIEDIRRDGLDPVQFADLAISEAQEELSRMQEPKSRAELVKSNARQMELRNTIDYYTAMKESLANGGTEAQGYDAMGEEREENINVEPQQPIVEEKTVPSRAKQTVEEQKQQRIAEAKSKYGELFDDDFTKANDVYELVSMWIGRKRNLAWDDVRGKRGLQKELGWVRKIGGDTKYIETLLAKSGEGMGVDEFAHMVWESDENHGFDGEPRWDSMEIKQALLDLIQSAQSKSDVVDYALNTRIAQAEAAMQQEEQERQRYEEEQGMEDDFRPLTEEQIADMEANLPFPQTTDEDIPDAPITLLMKAVDELRQQEGMPEIKLVDTDRMRRDEWYDIASTMYDGVFVSQEEIDFVRNSVLRDGLYIINEESGAITVYSDSQTAEEVKYKVEYIKEQNNGRSNEEKTGGLEAKDVQRPEEGMSAVQGTTTPAAEGATGTEGEGSTSTNGSLTERDEYLTPRNAEEERIIAGIDAQLQQEISAASNEVNNARSALEKAQVRESDRATDMFGNDNAFNEAGQLFDNSDMPTDQSAEGVERRTEAERERLMEAEARLENLQSDVERNSRIRGALDNHRRQVKIETDNPIEAIEQAARGFEERGVRSGNKIFTDEAHDEVLRKLRAKFSNLNAGFDPEIALLMLQDAGYHIERGARKIADCAKAMIEELGDFVRPYIKSAYNAVRDYPGMEEIRKEMSSHEEVEAFDEKNFDQNVLSSEEKSVSLRGTEEENKFVTGVTNAMLGALRNNSKPFRSINDLRNLARESGMEVDSDGRDDILLQELTELALVKAGKSIINSQHDGQLTREAFKDIQKLYDMQPTISQRSSNRIQMQQYSTPLPMSFVAQAFVGSENERVFEPTAGNGMLVFGLNPKQVTVNELDETRLANLQGQGFAAVLNQDATEPFEGEEQYDAVIANPPFGSAEAKEYDGKMIPGLAEQIALNALSKMKDGGRAAIIIGGNTEWEANGAIKNQKAFMTYLYDHYNVKGVIDMDGKLYQKQGTTYPTRMILIDGRRSESERAQTKVYPPKKENAPRKATSFDELKQIAEELKNNNDKTDGTEKARNEEEVLRGGRPGDGSSRPSGNYDEGRRAQEYSTTSQERGITGREADIRGRERVQPNATQVRLASGSGAVSSERGNNGTNRTDSEGKGLHSEQVVVRGVRESGLEQPKKEAQKRKLDTDKLSYRPHNTSDSLDSVAPVAMVEAMDNMLSKIEKEHGDIETWLQSELGYDTLEKLHNALAAEQLDSVAMAIYQMQHGQAMIIGDQTGVGKGRQMAALIRWACRQGKKPIFVTYTADLLSDIYRDLVDVGSENLRPFIFNSDGAMEDKDGNKVYKPLSSDAQKKVFETGKLPDGYDFVALTYSQVSTGDSISKAEAKDTAKKEGKRYQTNKQKKPRSDAKAVFLRSIAKDNYLFMDESHNAAGESNTGAYFQSIVKDAKAVTFASATFAKRPDTMPLYAIRTAMSKAKVKANELIKIIENGGVTLQEIMSRALTQAGQMVRRERDMSDVKTDWKTVDDPAIVKKARENYDKTIAAFNAIIDFQNNYVKPYLENLSRDLAEVASSADTRRGTDKLGIDNPPFVSKTYNYTKQLMLALKVDAIVDEVVKEIDAGRHPVIALDNTMGSFLEDYNPGDKLDETTFAASLLRGLKSVLKYTIKDEDGKEQQSVLSPSQLGEDGAAAYKELESLIRESTSGIFISPLDAIIEKLNQKGYSVGELTGRDKYVELDENTGDYVVRKRTDKDKKKLAREFNKGDRDVLILNKSASTGISLHASERFRDQRQRSMIIAQPLADINDYMQMIGRIDRTGQVHRGYYINLGLPVPAEGRFLMMLSTKLKSLNANTTTSQESESNDVDAPDLLNKYGSQVVIEYLRDNPDIYVKMGEPLKTAGKNKKTVTAGELDSYTAQEDDARKITGYVALLPTAEQDAFYDDVVRRYTELIQYLDDTGSNDLKISVMPLRARTIDKDISSEGVDPSGNNPFAGHAYVEWVEMDVLKKPMKAAEVEKTIGQLNPEASDGTNGVDGVTSRVQQIIDTVEREADAKLQKEEARYETAKQKAEEDIAARTETINKQEKRTEEQKREAIADYSENRRQTVEESHSNMVNKIRSGRQNLLRYLRMFKVGGSVLVPDDLTTDTFMGSSPGIFCGFKAKDEGVTPSTTLAVFATLDGRRKIEVKLSDWQAIARIDRMTQDNWDAAQRVTLSNWDSEIPTETRRRGYIMTGNILQAFSDTSKDGKIPGQLVTFTDIDGNVRDGILMNQKWEPTQLNSSNVPLSMRMDEVVNLPISKTLVSADGEVAISHWYGTYVISVPKSKKAGGKYYNDERLLDLADGRVFYPRSGRLAADIPEGKIRDAVNVLSELGVQMASERQVNLSDSGRDERKYHIVGSDPLDAISRAANSWRKSAKEDESSLNSPLQKAESEKKSVPLERRTMKSYTDSKGVYHEGIEDELARIEGEISQSDTKGDSQKTLESQQKDSSRGSGEVGQAYSLPNSGRRVNDLRKQAAKLRAEIARRNQKKQDLRNKYNIDEKGNISLNDLVRMFRDLNNNKAIGKLFDKVVKVLKNLGVSFRFIDSLDAQTAGMAGALYNITFYNWDTMLRDRSNQDKASDILHEMIHNVAEHIIMRYDYPELSEKFGKLTPEMKKAAKEIKDIFKAVRAAKLKKPNGKTYYGSSFANEMIAELADINFRKALDTIPYQRDVENSHRTVWQAIKEWFRKIFGVNSTLDSLGDVLDNILDSYDNAGINAYRQQRAIMEQRTMDEGRTGDYIDYVEANEINASAKIVDDEKLINQLNNEPKITVYRAMQLQNGKLYPPMAAKVNGKWQDPLPLGKWSQADEHPELVDKNGKFTLDKGNGKTVAGVVYAPYMHGSTTMLNDQFKEAQDRPELVVVEAEMPESELTSGYQAEKSPRKTGRLPWKAGTIQGQLTGTRDVILSRWVRPVRIVPASEVAQSIKQMIDGQVDVMPTNVVTPEQREELEKLGVKFVKTNNQEIVQEGEHKGEQYSNAYGKKSKKSKAKRNKAVDGDPLGAISRAAAAWRRSVADDEGMTPEAHSAKAIYDDRLNRVETVFTEAYQDSMIALKTAQNAIAKDKDIPDSQNAYMAENLMHGKNKNEQDLFNQMFRDPLIETINKIMNLTGMNWGDVDRYVYTKSGLERNREFFVRDNAPQPPEGGEASVAERWQELKDDRYADLQAGVITFPEYLESLDQFIRENIDEGYNPSEHDYSGFRDMFGDEEGKYDEAEVISELMDAEDKIGEENVNALWERINTATRYGLERYREAGMRSDEQIDQTEGMFHWYVPMRGFKEERGEDMYQYFTQKGSAKSYVGGLLKHAKGRGSEANYPISTIFAMTYKAISDCNQNLVNQKLYRLCQANPNDLIVLSDSWAVLNEVTEEWEEVGPEIPEDASEEDVRQATLAFEERMKQLASEEKARKITGKARFDYKPMDKKKQSEHVVEVRMNGQPRKMIVVGNPRMAQALNGQLRFERGKNVFSKWNNAVKNFMASVFTSYSPTFALRNMMRDWTHFRMMLGVREGERYAKQASKYYRQSLFKMVGLFKKYREGTLDMNKEMERDFKDFMDNGGVTGFVQMQKIDDIQKEMEKLYEQQKQGKPIRLNNALWDNTLGAIEALNEGIENNARFATFRASRHYAGRTKARSAYDAKEITVNFNKKGAGSKTMGFKSGNKKVEDAAKAFGVTSQVLGEGRIFFNATVQAIATTFKNFQNADGSLNKGYIAKWAARYAAPPFLFGLALPYINMALAAALGGDDDDPYANLPEWTRRKNLCIYIGGGNFLTIPVGQELAAFLALGDVVAGNTYAPNLKPVDKSWDDEIVGVMNTFSPVDVNTKITHGGLMEDPVDEVAGRTFSVLAPLVAVGQNLSWTGRPIYREDRFQNDQHTPEYQMVYQNVNPVLVEASRLLHELGGGDDVTRGKLEVNPAIIQYLWEQYTGGPGKVFSNTISIGKDAKDILTGNESDFNIRKVEGLKAFVQQGDDRTQYYRTQAKYFKYKADAEKLHHDVEGYEKAAKENPEYLLKLEQISKGTDFVRMQIVREADKELSKINKAANAASGNERRELRRIYNEQVKAVVELLDEVRR